jgi:hypothetical protein
MADEPVLPKDYNHTKRFRVYIAGPMTGLPEFNHPAFHAAARELRMRGFDVVSPAELNENTNALYEDCMRRDIAELITCEGIHLLEGWENSRGAQVEFSIATILNLRVIE